MIYSIPYVLLVVFLGFLAILLYQRKDDKELCHKITILGILVYFLFFAFRGFINTDWMTYYVEFDKCSWDLLFNYELGKSREPGFLLFELLCKSLFDNFHFFVFMGMVVNTALLIPFFKRYTDNVLLALTIFLVFEGFVINANLMRNSISIFIFLNAIQYLQRREALRYFGMCLLAVTFHFSAFVYFPMYFFLHRSLNKWVYLAIFLTCIAVFVLHVPIFLGLVKLTGIGGAFIEDKIEVYTEIGSARGFGMVWKSPWTQVVLSSATFRSSRTYVQRIISSSIHSWHSSWPSSCLANSQKSVSVSISCSSMPTGLSGTTLSNASTTNAIVICSVPSSDYTVCLRLSLRSTNLSISMTTF